MSITHFFKSHSITSGFALFSAIFYGSFAYDLERTDFPKLILLFAALFFFFYKMVQSNKDNIRLLTWIAFGCRAIFILAIPNLSQDFYRFIWDGRMIIEGINPYLFTPESFISASKFPIEQAQELYNGMGNLNGSHFTNYPPINQLCFVVAALFSGKSILGSVVVFRLIIIAADFGILYFGKKLLNRLKLPVHLIFWYILNPFIIIELTGNLHFEGVMIFFLIWSLFLLYNGKWQLSAVILALSVSVKLIPLLFLPLFYYWFIKKKDNHAALGLSKLIGFYAIISSVTVLLFLPFFSIQFIENYAETVGLWFQNFEFNASLYYLAREVGFAITGYNEIAIIGKVIPIIVIIFMLFLSFFKSYKTLPQLIVLMLLGLSFYYFTATTVHPWYIATLLILSIFTEYKFPLVWSFVIMLSYYAYAHTGFKEHLGLIAMEYSIVYSVFIWEVLIKKSTRQANALL